MRTFNLTLTTSYQQLYALIAATTGAIPTDGFLPKTVRHFALQATVANAGDPIYVSDANHANNAGTAIYAGDWAPTRQSNVNNIDLTQVYLKGTTNGNACVVQIAW